MSAMSIDVVSCERTFFFRTFNMIFFAVFFRDESLKQENYGSNELFLAEPKLMFSCSVWLECEMVANRKKTCDCDE